ncbi:TRAP transporter small permease [Georgenia thermotolerans]|uniref:TRAP transporter small permease n=1 Tax=Georgenia thermotolerans TaxID=527326 RepID=UPI001D01587E|nr:TRAP transporter small permease [Georgenia thermotolerans]
MLDRVLSVACIILFAVLVVDVVWQVASRQLLGNPSTWSEEAARYIFVWLGLFGSALVFSERGHIAVDFVVRLFPKPLMRAALIFVQLAIITLAAVVFIYGGWKYVQQSSGQQLSALPFTVGTMYTVMPITGVLIVWYALTHLIEALRVPDPASLLAVDEEAEAALATYGDDETAAIATATYGAGDSAAATELGESGLDDDRPGAGTDTTRREG